LFANDLRVDQHAPAINARDPAITFQRSLDFAVAWQADRGNGKHDIYARFFGVFGSPKGNQFPVNSPLADDTGTPAIVSDSTNKVFIAWEEYLPGASGPRKIMIAKFDSNGGPLVSPTPVSTGDDTVERRGVQLAIDSADRVLATWWEYRNDLSLPPTVYMRRFNNSLEWLDATQVKVNDPPPRHRWRTGGSGQPLRPIRRTW
jgi:hypothetical protein